MSLFRVYATEVFASCQAEDCGTHGLARFINVVRPDEEPMPEADVRALAEKMLTGEHPHPQSGDIWTVVTADTTLIGSEQAATLARNLKPEMGERFPWDA
jgi:hypothetical protein